MLNFLKRKYDRFFESSKLFKIKRFIQENFKEKNIGDIGFDFKDKPHRFNIIQEIINIKNYKTYLEIGCFANEVFNKIKILEKIGVDPVSGGTIKSTSDNFFKANTKTFDCIFIDGLHKYKQVKKDINNSLLFLNKGGIILLHDCLPNNVFDQAVPRCQYHWNGDVWKAIVECRTHDELDVYTCYADMGIGVIFKRKNTNKLSINIQNFSKLKFHDYFHNYKKFMNIISYEKLLKIL